MNLRNGAVRDVRHVRNIPNVFCSLAAGLKATHMTTAPLRGYRDSEIREILDALLCRQGDGNSEFGWEPFKDAAMLGAGYPTKKALKAAVGQTLQFIESSMFEPEYDANGTFCVVGPSPYERKWYAKVTMKNGLIFKVE